MPALRGLECHIVTKSHGRWKPLSEHDTTETLQSLVETYIYVQKQKFAVKFVTREYIHDYLQVSFRFSQPSELPERIEVNETAEEEEDGEEEDLYARSITVLVYRCSKLEEIPLQSDFAVIKDEFPKAGTKSTVEEAKKMKEAKDTQQRSLTYRVKHIDAASEPYTEFIFRYRPKGEQETNAKQQRQARRAENVDDVEVVNAGGSRY